MDLDMLVEVGTLCKAMVAVWIFASVWSLICVDSEVVKEVVPLPEPFVTAHLIALQNLNKSLRLRILVRKDSVGFGVGNMLLYLDCVKVEGLS